MSNLALDRCKRRQCFGAEESLIIIKAEQVGDRHQIPLEIPLKFPLKFPLMLIIVKAVLRKLRKDFSKYMLDASTRAIPQRQIVLQLSADSMRSQNLAEITISSSMHSEQVTSTFSTIPSSTML